MSKRLGTKNDADEVLSHRFFEDINIQDLKDKKVKAPWVPVISEDNWTLNFDPSVTSEDA